MSDLAPGYGDAPGDAAAPRPAGWRRALNVLGLVLPLGVAVAVAAPRLWHTVRTEPTPSIAVQQLPAQQPPAGSQLPTEQAPPPAQGQVADLGRFAARDPFVSPLPRVRKAAAPAAAATASAATPAGTPAVAPATAPAATPPAATPAAATPAPTAAPATTSATISINGIAEQVAVDGSFPAADPVFKLVAIGAGAVQIAVLAETAAAATASSGAAAAGAGPAPPQTVTLEQGRSLTLLDTATGARYELRLASSP